MSDETRPQPATFTSRRNALRRAFLGALGLAGIASSAQARERTAATADRTEPRERTVVLALGVRDLDRYAGDRGPREQLDLGERETVSATLVDGSGRTVGRITGIAFGLTGPGTPAMSAERLELRTLHLDGGTITASGTTGSYGGTLAVTGGTGAYAGVRGVCEIADGEPDEARLTLRIWLATAGPRPR